MGRPAAMVESSGLTVPAPRAAPPHAPVAMAQSLRRHRHSAGADETGSTGKLIMVPLTGTQHDSAGDYRATVTELARARVLHHLGRPVIGGTAQMCAARCLRPAPRSVAEPRRWRPLHHQWRPAPAGPERACQPQRHHGLTRGRLGGRRPQLGGRAPAPHPARPAGYPFCLDIEAEYRSPPAAASGQHHPRNADSTPRRTARSHPYLAAGTPPSMTAS